MPLLSSWALERKYVYILLYCADRGIDISNFTKALPRLTDDEKLSLINAINFKIDLTKTLELTEKALGDVAGSLTVAHEAAGAITVGAPTAGQYDVLEHDLNKLSLYVMRDQAAKAISGFLADAANSIHALNRS
jgi:hypothetical protein